MRVRRLVALLALVVVATGWLATPRPSNALVNATISVTSSPNPSVTTTTIKIVVKFAAPVTNIRIWIERQGGYGSPNKCTPACAYYALSGSPTWVYPSASGTITMTFLTNAVPGGTDVVWHDGFSAEVPSLREKYPTITMAISRAPTGVVMPGDPVHVTTKVTTNAGPLTRLAILHLPATGVSEPTNLPPGGYYNATEHFIYLSTVTANLTVTLTYDVVITAAVGTKLTFTSDYIDAIDNKATMSFTVGVAATPKPTPTPRATKQPPSSTPAATSGPTTAPASPIGSPTAGPSPTASTGATLTPTSTIAPSPAALASAPAATVRDPVSAPAREDLGGGFALGLALVLGAGFASLALFRLFGRRS